MRYVLVPIVAFVLFAAAPASAERHRFDDPPSDAFEDAPQEGQPFDAMTETNGGIPHEQLRQDFDHRQFDGTMGARQQPAPMQPYWGTMSPYWNGSEPPGVIHRGARTRGFTKTK